MEQTTAHRAPEIAPSPAVVGRVIYLLPILEAEDEREANAAAFGAEEEDWEGYIELLALEAEAREEYRLMSLWGRG